ncbi:hypothetical protein PIB30_034755 [Stylosanthes scabra]|uniref:Uncharacterized protein n=1 Tax=Stylosanthes scabra TaxID=79078 RepID=A0ABU6ZC39_9FABA|nr:hypothetical protein [Stylosanthes scabra]
MAAATTLSSSLFATTTFKGPPPHSSTSSHFPLLSYKFNPLTTRQSLPRVRATMLQDNEEKVKLKESVPSKISTFDDAGKASIESGDSTTSSSSSSFEKFVIKVEQSVNIFLTDSVIKILDTLYHDRDYARFFVLETIARVPYFVVNKGICCALVADIQY